MMGDNAVAEQKIILLPDAPFFCKITATFVT